MKASAYGIEIQRHKQGKDGPKMATPEEKNFAVSKLLAKTDKVVYTRNAAKRAPSDQLVREYGRLDKAIDELSEAAEGLRRAES